MDAGDIAALRHLPNLRLLVLGNIVLTDAGWAALGRFHPGPHSRHPTVLCRSRHVFLWFRLLLPHSSAYTTRGQRVHVPVSERESLFVMTTGNYFGRVAPGFLGFPPLSEERTIAGYRAVASVALGEIP